MFVRKKGAVQWIELDALPAFGRERELEELLAGSPQLLPGEPVNLALVRQLHIPAVNGYVDLCGVASDGSIYLVECKLAGNSEMRRTVVGQLLAYAAGLAGVSRSDFLTGFARAVAVREDAATDPQSYFELIPQGERDPDYDSQRFLDNLEANLAAGRFRLVFAVDKLTDELRRVVEYLEKQMRDVSVSALELTFARYEGVELIGPVLHGAGRASAEEKSTMPAATTVVEFDAAQSMLPVHVQTAFREIRAATVAAGGQIWGGRHTQPTVYGSYDVTGGLTPTWRMSANPNQPGFGILWRWLHGPLSVHQLEQLYDQVKDIPGAEIWNGLDAKWNYVNLLPAAKSFADPTAALHLMAALHEALGRSRL